MDETPQDLRRKLPRCSRCGGLISAMSEHEPVPGRPGSYVHRRCKPAPGRPPGRTQPHRISASVDDATLERLRRLDPSNMSAAIRVAAELADKFRQERKKRPAG